MGRSRKTPYDDRSDLEKLQSQWSKIRGIFEREKEWSAAIVRAATAAEIAANISVRKRFEAESQFSGGFIDSLLVWANGLDGKFKRLIVPSEHDEHRRATLVALKRHVETLNKRRNDIAHRGVFSSAKEAKKLVEIARSIAMTLVQPWEPTFTLEKPWSSDSKERTNSMSSGSKSGEVT